MQQQEKLRFEVVVKASDDGPLRLEASGDVGEDRADGLEELRALLERAVAFTRQTRPATAGSVGFLVIRENRAPNSPLARVQDAVKR